MRAHSWLVSSCFHQLDSAHCPSDRRRDDLNIDCDQIRCPSNPDCNRANIIWLSEAWFIKVIIQICVSEALYSTIAGILTTASIKRFRALIVYCQPKVRIELAFNSECMNIYLYINYLFDISFDICLAATMACPSELTQTYRENHIINLYSDRHSLSR